MSQRNVMELSEHGTKQKHELYTMYDRKMLLKLVTL